MKQHEFDIQLPLFPYTTVGQQTDPELKLEMDGQPLQGVTSICVKAGNNGFTNVAVEFEASTAIKANGALFASLAADDEWAERNLAQLMTQAADTVANTREEFEMIHFDLDMQARMAKRFIELLIENGTGVDVSGN